MAGNIKAEVLANILGDAATATPIDGKANVYSPEEYNKIAAKNRAMGLVSDTEYLESHISPGAVEFDANHNLKHIARNAPKMLDLATYTANRYMVEKILPVNAKKQGKKAGTYILMVMGNAIVTAINNTQELPPTVKAYRFIRKEKEVWVDESGAEQTLELSEVDLDNPESEKEVAKKIEEARKGLTAKKIVSWEYVGAEFIKDEVAYKMTKQLDPDSVLKLRAQIDDNPNPRMGDNVYGDSLDEIE